MEVVPENFGQPTCASRRNVTNEVETVAPPASLFGLERASTWNDLHLKVKSSLKEPHQETVHTLEDNTMTEVLSFQPDGNTHFGTPLRRSSSQTSYLTLQTPSPYSRSSSNLKSRYAAIGYDVSKMPASLPSSAPSSPRFSAPGFSNQPSYTSTPSSSLSLDEQCDQEREDIVFPSYDGLDQLQDAGPASPPGSREGATATPTSPSQVDFSESMPAAGDDSNLRTEPSRHVDYLSHNWREQDIWASWRHIVARRKEYSNSIRLENASWRSWAKSRLRLKSVSPETLNW